VSLNASAGRNVLTVSCSVIFARDSTVPGLLSEFVPIPSLRKLHADTNLYFLAGNEVRFEQESDDPWFSAHKQARDLYIATAPKRSAKSFSFDIPATVLGCASQSQLCNPNLPEAIRCSTPSGWKYVPDSELARLWPDNRLRDGIISQLQAQGTLFVEPSDVLGLLGASALTARLRLTRGIQRKIPANQWQLEMEHLFNTSLASLQKTFAQTAIGHTPDFVDITRRPDTPEERYFCQNQVND